jgi:hypothetical protein
MQGMGRDPRAPWTQPERERLVAIGNEYCDSAEQRGITGRDLLWKVDRQRILRDLLGFLEVDEQWRLEGGWEFEAAELTFGMAAEPGRNEHPALTVELPDGRAIAFRGKIDRVDRGPGGKLAVIDYKSGRMTPYDAIRNANGAERLAGGKHLQLPIYALAAAAALGPEGEVSTYYRALAEREQYRAIGYTVGSEERDALGETLGVLVGTVEQGLFPANPGERDWDSYANCKYCPYDALCPGGDRIEAWVERQRAKGLEAYVLLSGGEPGGENG